MKNRKGFYLCVLGLCVTAVPLFTDGGRICGVLGPALVLFGVLWNGLRQSKAKDERKPLSKMKVIQLCCLAASAGNSDLRLSAIGPGDAADESAADFHGADDDRGLPSGNDERDSGRRDLTRCPQAGSPYSLL